MGIFSTIDIFSKTQQCILVHQEYYEHYVLIKGDFLIWDTTLTLGLASKLKKWNVIVSNLIWSHNLISHIYILSIGTPSSPT
jgi:hypothetical protein